MRNKVLLIGASTGGPSQIKELLSSITSLRYTIIIAQHMKEEVLPFFINDLKDVLKIKVQTTPLKISFNEPSVIVCSESCILKKSYGAYNIITDKTEQKYTPDINKLLNSFVPYSDDFDLSVLIMTGIGKDGVDGARNLKIKGAFVYAQDEKSSPVFGMPKAAIESGIVNKIQTIEEIKQFCRDL